MSEQDTHSTEVDARRDAAAALGRAKSEAKTKAARENGKKGGRPRGSAVKESGESHTQEAEREEP